MLTKISETAMVDLAKVSGLETTPEGILLHTGGKSFVVTEPIQEILRRINDGGNDNMQWAGK